MGLLKRFRKALYGLTNQPETPKKNPNATRQTKTPGPNNRYMSKEEAETLRDAEHFYQEPTVRITKTVFETAKKGEGITTKEETQHITKNGRAEAITIVTKPMAACSKPIPSDEEIAGFCAICDEAVCNEHIQFCVGYGSNHCQKILCPKHTLYFPDEKGEEQPCCIEHYNMKIDFQKDIPDLDTRPEKKSNKSKKDNE